MSLTSHVFLSLSKSQRFNRFQEKHRHIFRWYPLRFLRNLATVPLTSHEFRSLSLNLIGSIASRKNLDILDGTSFVFGQQCKPRDRETLIVITCHEELVSAQPCGHVFHDVCLQQMGSHYGAGHETCTHKHAL